MELEFLRLELHGKAKWRGKKSTWKSSIQNSISIILLILLSLHLVRSSPLFFFCGFFFCRFLSFLCLGSFLFLQVPFFFFTMGFFLLHVLSGQFFSFVFSGFFFCRSLSLVYLGSFLFLQIPFFFFTMDFFLLRVLSILMGTVLLLPLWVTSSFLFSNLLLSSSDSFSYSMKLKSLRLEFYAAKICPCQQSISSL